MRPVTLLAWGILLAFATIGVIDTIRRYSGHPAEIRSSFSGKVEHLSGRQKSGSDAAVPNNGMPHRELEAVDYETVEFNTLKDQIKLSSFLVSKK